MSTRVAVSSGSNALQLSQSLLQGLDGEDGVPKGADGVQNLPLVVCRPRRVVCHDAGIDSLHVASGHDVPLRFLAALVLEIVDRRTNHLGQYALSIRPLG